MAKPYMDEFTLEAMTDSINIIPEVPSLLASYFDAEGVTTTSVKIDMEKETLRLVPNSKRGSDGPEAPEASTRTVVTLECAHLVTTDILTPDEVQNIRAFGSETEVEVMSKRITQKLARMRRNIEATKEYHRVGAIRGKILDADGKTVLRDLYHDFNVEAPAEVSITWPGDSTGAKNGLLSAFRDVVYQIEDELGGVAYDGVTAVVGRQFWDYLTSNPFVREAYNLWQGRMAAFGEVNKNVPFNYGGINWLLYSKVIGNNHLVETDAAHVFPYGRDLLKEYYAPADYNETVNTVGLPYYAIMEEKRKNKGYDMEAQSNPLMLHMFPKTLITLRGKA